MDRVEVPGVERVGQLDESGLDPERLRRSRLELELGECRPVLDPEVVAQHGCARIHGIGERLGHGDGGGGLGTVTPVTRGPGTVGGQGAPDGVLDEPVDAHDALRELGQAPDRVGSRPPTLEHGVRDRAAQARRTRRIEPCEVGATDVVGTVGVGGRGHRVTVTRYPVRRRTRPPLG
ncbi:hypothetical protein [Tsukamurella soli]|uniref:hypothetical protein n=1 Tax=Tsukamurella soli TaxID=644556 RepID=UPI0036169CA7